MAEAKKEPTDAEVAAKTGFGATAEEEARETSTETEEETETSEEEADETVEADESESEEEAVEEKPAARSKRDTSKTDEEEESDEAEDESEEDETTDEDESTETGEERNKKRTVPYSKLKSANSTIKTLRAELAIAVAGKSKADNSGDEDAAEDADKEVADVAKKLGEELGLDEAGVEKILKAAVKLSSKKGVVPKDIEEKLKDLDDLKKQNLAQKEAAHFMGEWDGLNIRKQYPNASKSALKEAQELMDKMAHSKEHHTHDLDYILFKNKAKFETILKTAAKGKSGETGKRVGKDDASIESGENEEDLVDITELNPEIMKQREARERKMRRDHRNDKDYTVHSPIQED